MSEFDDDYVANDFYSIIGDAQFNELQDVERRREAERAQMRDLEEQRQLAEGRKASTMSLMQLAGLQSQKELDAVAAEKNAADEKRVQEEELKRKEIEHAKLVNQFPPPNISNS